MQKPKDHAHDLKHAENAAFVVFSVNQQRFALAVHCVQEIVSMPAVVPLPNASPPIRGLFNLRGKIIPFLDPRHPPSPLPATPHACVLVLRCAHKQAGVLVDDVESVVHLSAPTFTPAPNVHNPFSTVATIAGHSNDGDWVLLDLLQPSKKDT